MKLTAEMFTQIVSTLRSDRASQSRELRKNPRVGIRGRATIRLHGRQVNKTLLVTVRDLSTTGIGILSPELIGKGENFVLLLTGSNETENRAMFFLVKRCLQVNENQYSIGASFVREVTGERFDGDPLPPPPPPPAATMSARPARPAPAGPSMVAQSVSDELLSNADTKTVDDLEARLKKLAF